MNELSAEVRNSNRTNAEKNAFSNSLTTFGINFLKFDNGVSEFGQSDESYNKARDKSLKFIEYLQDDDNFHMLVDLAEYNNSTSKFKDRSMQDFFNYLELMNTYFNAGICRREENTQGRDTRSGGYKDELWQLYRQC